MSVSNARIIESLERAGVRPSGARVHVLKYLESNRNHPTADTLFRGLKDVLPTLSRASVYNTVTALESAGLIRRLNIDGGEARYDAHMPDHGHFRCEACGAVRDFDTDLGALDLSALDGYTVGKRDLFVFGKCPDCQKK